MEFGKRHRLLPEGDLMHVTVRLFASLARFSPGGLPGTPFGVDLPEFTTIQGLIAHLHMPGEETKVLFVNGLIRDLDSVLQPDDVVGIFPPIGGG
jgi:molybdopterin synthase sulfur carrier subunit